MSFLSVVLPAANVVRLLWILRTPRLVGGLMRCMRVKDVLSGQAAEESTDQTTVRGWGTHSLARSWLAGWLAGRAALAAAWAAPFRLAQWP